MSENKSTSSSGGHGNEDAITNYLGGYRRYYLDHPIHLEFVSENLCKMLGYTKEEVDGLVGGAYACLMHPEDAPRFDSFLRGFTGEEKCASVPYRLIRKDGSTMSIVDTMTSRMCDDGHLRGHSVVCEIPNDPRPHEPGSFSIMKMTGGPDARIELMNDAASELLSLGETQTEHRLTDFVSLNDRHEVLSAFERALSEGYSGRVPCVIVSTDGNPRRTMLWVRRITEAECDGSAGFCVIVEGEASCRQECEGRQAFSRMLLTNLAEDVLELDIQDRSIKRLNSGGSCLLQCPVNVRMFADDAIRAFSSRVLPDDRHSVIDFFVRAMSNRLKPKHQNLARTRFALANDDGTYQAVVATVVPVTSSKVFICLDSNTRGSDFGSHHPYATVRKHVSVRMFGSFSVAVDGKTVRFKSEKARELLALLIEKRGAHLTSREAIGALWECAPDERSRPRYRKVASRLMAELGEMGIAYIVESERGVRRVIPEFIECDYYDYLDGKRPPSGAFLPEYSWSEYVKVD